MPFDATPQTETETTVGPVERVLIAARRLIERPENWIKGSLAVGDKFCAVGSFRTMADASFEIDAGCYKYLTRAIGGISIPYWNDAPERTHAEVLDAFSRAIALAAAENA